jgi:glycosyltransferase involved in cell wall biosynthesis
MVPYKKIDLIVETFTRKFPNKKLIVIGDGPDYSKIKALAGRNIEFLGRAPFDELHQHLASARAFVFAAEEDFGIAPLEAQSCGTPVIALGKGGALETVVGLDSTSPTGVFFPEQSVDALARAVDEFEENAELMTSINCRENALRFSEQLFQSEFKDFVSDKSVIFEDQLICSSERLSNSG